CLDATMTIPAAPAPLSRKRRILFVAEAVTLAHVARPRVLAQALDPARFETHLAAAPTFDTALHGFCGRRWPLTSIPPARFMQALADGSPIYDAQTLTDYVEEDLALLDQVQPDLVVGDFRLSLAVSAPLRGVPYVALTNAHWSPYAALDRWPVPDLPFVHILGERASIALFNRVRPLVFWLHGRALNQVRQHYGLAPVGDMLHAYTWGDETLYLDVPELIPTQTLPPDHRFIGPILWEPDTPTPAWWNAVPDGRPCVYLTLGSSGPARLLPRLITSLSRLPINLLVATVGRVNLGQLPANVFAVNYLPGGAAARRSVLTLCNGGSGTVYQSLAQGTPVLGIASNLDQHLTMHWVTAAGAGQTLRSERATPARVMQAAEAMLAEPGWTAGAGRVAGWFNAQSAVDTFSALVDARFQVE
ncbi:MAG TPA: nucleotide disphospho-sugar-binding domain-containing protein, partial [Lamprocystis sp. (in: g-proteobacteria)]|nr:nucleotide disphospho-sugar-binding domain-containing protein [Lamprocystis sp. (in: g-proteobacteria)]